jgi:hypothetical protein
MSDPILDITAIEQAVEARLVERIAPLRKTAVQKDGRFIFTNPALTVCIFESGKWLKQGQKSYLVPCTLQVLLTVSSAKSEEDRRRIANPLVFAIVIALAQQTLDLNLKAPGIEPELFRDVTDAEDWQNNKIVYLIQFACGFSFEVPRDDDAAADLLTVGLSYFLQPDDGAADVADTVTLGE